MRNRDVLDLFSAAAAGWSLGMHRAGFRTVAACELIEWRRTLYAENNPNVKVYDDVRTLTADRLVRDLGSLPSIVVGSPPCQDISSANTKGRGVEGERSGLYFEAVRIIGEVRPRWFALENSANLRTRGADAVLPALEAIGYSCWPLVVRAGDDPRGRGAGIGANHERERCWIVGFDPEQVANAGEGQIGSITGLCEGANPFFSRSDHADASCPRYAGRGALRSGWEARDQHAGNDDNPSARTPGGRDTSDADQARQADGCLEPSVRSPQIADDGCGAGRGDDRSCSGQMGLCASDRSDALHGGPGWTLADLADHIRLDDGLSARLAWTRIALGDGKRQSAASLIVEAFGDAVVPQIPEAIGRAILRTEAALAAVVS